MLVNVHRRRTANRGDLASGPLQYVASNHPVRFMDVMSCQGDNESAEKILSKATLIVFGGGGLLDHAKFDPALVHLLKNYGSKLAVWGAGSNTVPSKPFESALSQARLVGRRDFPQESPVRWVPCASCLHPRFAQGRRAASTRRPGGIGIFENNSGTNTARVGDCGRSEVRRMGNKAVSFDQVIDFIESCDLLVTSSFHGAYWATLCQVPVIGIPTTKKFHTFRHQIPLATADDWTDFIEAAPVFPEAYDQCVAANVDFMKAIAEQFPGVELKWSSSSLKGSSFSLPDAIESAKGFVRRAQRALFK